MEVNYVSNLKLNKDESLSFSKAHGVLLGILSEMEKDDNNLITGKESGDTWGLVDFRRVEEILSFLEYNDNYILEQGESS